MGYLWRYYRDHSIGFVFAFFLTAMGTLLRLQAYVFAMFCLAGAVISAVTWCLASPKIKKLESDVDRPIPLILAMFITTIGIWSIWGIWNQRDILSAPSGWLVPADEPSPVTSCKVPVDALAIYFGKSVAWTKTFPHTGISYGNEARLVLDRDEHQKIAVTVIVNAQNGDQIAKIDKNHFNLTNKALPTHERRRDESTLAVQDEKGNDVLKARYYNRRAFEIEATLYYSGRKITIPPGRSDNSVCMGNNAVDFGF